MYNLIIHEGTQRQDLAVAF